MPGCGHCGARLSIIGNQIGRRDTCAECGGELRSCVCCRHYDPNAAKSCKEPFAEVPDDKEGANFCEFFQVGEGEGAIKKSRADAMSAAEALFRKR